MYNKRESASFIIYVRITFSLSHDRIWFCYIYRVSVKLMISLCLEVNASGSETYNPLGHIPVELQADAEAGFRIPETEMIF